MASGSGWILWVWLAGGKCIYECGCKEVYDFLILLIRTPFVSALFCLLFVHFKNVFSFLFQYFL